MNPADNTDNNSIMTDTESEYSVAPPPPPQASVGDGRFAYVENKWMRDMLQNGWQAVSITESWYYLKNIKMESFSWSDDPKIMAIGYKMEELGASHSGASFGCTMRDMEYIAKHGEASYKALINKNKI